MAIAKKLDLTEEVVCLDETCSWRGTVAQANHPLNSLVTCPKCGYHVALASQLATCAVTVDDEGVKR